MNEFWSAFLYALMRGGILTVFIACYVAGGRQKKWVRRFIGGAWLAVTCAILSQSFGWHLLPLAGYPAALTLGYGGDDLITKLWRRGLYGLALGFLGLTVGILAGLWAYGLIQAVLALLASIILGVLNPGKTPRTEEDAVREEGLIALFSVAIVPFMM